eukprot:6168471-Prymnesium_polylepis.2
MAQHGSQWPITVANGTTRFPMADHGSQWPITVPNGTARFPMAQHGSQWHGTVPNGAALFPMAQHGSQRLIHLLHLLQYENRWEVVGEDGDKELSRCLMCNTVVGPYQKNAENRASKRKNHRFKGAENGCQHPGSPNMLKERVGRGFASTQRRLTI